MTLRKCVTKNLDTISLSGMRLAELPNFFEIGPELTILVDVNLSNNNLFNGRKIFEVRRASPHFVKFSAGSLSTSQTSESRFKSKLSEWLLG